MAKSGANGIPINVNLSIALALIAFSTYVYLSFMAFFDVSGPSQFQRAGSVGVATSVLIFLAWRALIDHVRFDDRDFVILTALDHLERKVDAAASGSSFTVVRSGVYTREPNDENEFPFGKVAKGLGGDMSVGAERLDRARNTAFWISIVELFMITAATLQWGYGDLVHCWAHGNGWQTC